MSLPRGDLGRTGVYPVSGLAEPSGVRWRTADRRGYGLLKTVPAVADGLVVLSLGFVEHRTRGGVLALDLASGAEVWRVEGERGSRCVLADQSASSGGRAGRARRGIARADEWLVTDACHAAVADQTAWLPRHREHGADRDHREDRFHGEFPWTSTEIVGHDLRTGQLRHTYVPDPGRYRIGNSPVVVAAGRVYAVLVDFGWPAWNIASRVDSPRPELHVLDAATGELVWQRELGLLPIGSLVLAGGLLYLAAADGEVHALDADSGELRWRAHVGAELGAHVDREYDVGADAPDPYAVVPDFLVPGDGVLYAQTRTGVLALG
ncbi:outer membrane protein assembly factor BamB family protein [Goodfellowiella coeruleoviolacea]|uniref:outer membrane protein assembly factor BamB family protein n=1 Tax=Goodfellowiella coeruleoviolacea TaxID=334858 RepID=UPI0020A4077C|nr:PQQ-binding-like beta-propeller repeat protein [Goodfellowiella coeruleoviolacea]